MMRKTALVTGSSRGIGRAITESLLDAGWRVFGLSRTDPGLYHEQFVYLMADLFLPTDLDLIGAFIRTQGLDALVHCAAVQGPVGPLRDSDSNAWNTCVQINLTGTYELVRACLPALEDRASITGDARMLLFSGGGAFNPRENYSAYAVSKAGVVSLMETLAVELQGSGVTVNCVAPGYVPTAMHGFADDHESRELDRAVACVLHLLSEATYGLTGKSVSAEYDDWASICPNAVEMLNEGVDGTRDRHKITMVAARLQNWLVADNRGALLLQRRDRSEVA